MFDYRSISRSNFLQFFSYTFIIIDFIIIQILRLIRIVGQMKKFKLLQKLIKNQEIVEQIILKKIIGIAHYKEDQRCKIDGKIYKYNKIKMKLKLKVFQEEKFFKKLFIKKHQ
ncbi:unnamed protein product [Paramecium sonneborni]|uniref:Transmembrane protein n=1 Tax=Paramecium sonneborni TaxID=65129 RepID=A0A8S1QUF0_9CILI|nr:unnamed protein product [Paramecium sonneborni]